MIVDDDVNLRKSLRRTLERSGYAVLEASDGNEAMVQYQNHHPDIVVTDLLMPEKEGIETIHELKKKYGDVKIIAMSGGGKLTLETYLKTARMVGAVFTLTKPFNRQDFLSVIEKALSSGRPQSG